MPQKLLAIFFLLLASFTLSACNSLDQAQSQFTDRITGISQNNVATGIPTLSPSPEPTLTDTEVDQALSSSPVEVDLSQDFSNLETELAQ